MIRKYWDFWRYFFRSVVDFALDLSWGIFEKKLFVEIASDFVISFGLWANTSGLLAWKFFVFMYFRWKILVLIEKIWWFSRTEFQLSKGSQWGKNKFRSCQNFLIDFLYLAESSAGFLKLRSSCPIKVFGEKYTFRKNLLFFIVFRFWVKTFATW